MTVRPEPVTALLVTGVAVCVFHFLERENLGSLVVAAVLVALALTAHPAGILALAPFLVAAPTLVRWARLRVAVAVTIIAAASAILATLAFVGSDARQRLADVETAQTLTTPTRDELLRYAFLSEDPFGTAIRRGAVALLLLAALAFLIQRARNQRGAVDYPAKVLVVAIVLLAAVPSKWPSHFGALLGIGSLAVAAESIRFRNESRLSQRWHAAPLLAILTATLVASWCWWIRSPWNTADLRTLDWPPKSVVRFGILQLSILLPFILLFAACLIQLARGRRDTLPAVPWRVAAWIPMVLAVPLIVLTFGTFVADTAKTNGWTFARQNIEVFLWTRLAA